MHSRGDAVPSYISAYNDVSNTCSLSVQADRDSIERGVLGDAGSLRKFFGPCERISRFTKIADTEFKKFRRHDLASHLRIEFTRITGTKTGKSKSGVEPPLNTPR